MELETACAKELELKPQTLRPKGKDWWEFFGYILANIGFTLAIGVIFAIVLLVITLSDMRGFLSITTPNELLSFAVMAWAGIFNTASYFLPMYLIGFRMGRFTLAGMGLKPLRWRWHWLTQALLITVFLFFLDLGISYLLGYASTGVWQPYPTSPTRAMMYNVKNPNIWNFLLGIAGMGLIIPIGEEVFFRGAIFGWLRRYYKFWASAIVSSVLFGIGHYDHLPLVFSAGIAGFFLAYLYEKDKSLLSPITLHAVNNTVGVLLLFISKWFPNLLPSWLG